LFSDALSSISDWTFCACANAVAALSIPDHAVAEALQVGLTLQVDVRAEVDLLPVAGGDVERGVV
jgi:hypothetical protein